MIQGKKNKGVENIIGLLLIVPIYLICFFISRFIDLSFLSYNMSMLLPGILMYLPVGIGLILVYKFYNDKINKLVFNINLIFLGITFYYYYSFNLVEHDGWDGLGFGILWYLNSFVCRVLSVILYKNIVGWKKALSFVAIFILLFIVMYAIGFLLYEFSGI